MEIFGTLGPSLLTEGKLTALIDAGVTILRINGAHSDGAVTASMIEQVRSLVGDRVSLMVDLPTNKVRVTNLSEPIVFGPGETFVIHGFQLNYPPLCQLVRAGDEVIVNNGMNRLEVTRADAAAIEFRADASGTLGNNRGLIFSRELHTADFPYFFPRDLELIEVINELAVDYVGLSYVRHSSDKEEAKRRIRNRNSLIYKIETRVAWENLEKLIGPGEKISIDRGDLAGEIGLLNIPHAQDRIIRFAHRHRMEVYVATQFLATMEHSPIPMVSEVTGLYEMIKLGVSGIQLSEETAVGKYPVEAVRWVRDIERLVEAEGYLASAHRRAAS
jgi:pyruvate kinase